MARLREATTDQHQSVERQLNLLRPDLTLRDYSRVLSGFCSVLRAWEPQVQHHLSPVLPRLTAGREKLPLVEDDLRFLGVSASPEPADLSGLHSVEALVGGMYVLEGSTLGGQILLRHLAPTLGVAPGRGASYFSGYGSSTGAMWKAFCYEAESFARLRDVGPIVAGARRMFDIVARELPQGADA